MRHAGVDIIQADLSLPPHQAAVLQLVDAYSRDPMGDGAPLSPEVRGRLITGLREHPTTLIFLALEADQPVGVAVCFRGFSTFAARPLINIHDLHVLPSHQGRGIGKALLAAVEAKAREMGCCKLSLEVQEHNHRARQTYASAGFGATRYQPDAGSVFFLSKRL